MENLASSYAIERN